jgi:methylenetetrahydrofolate reductase (NADPH)
MPTKGAAVNISIELVPRNEESLHQELKLIQENFSQVNTINIPDLMRFKTRSWHGCGLAKGYFKNTVPHIRAVDFDPDEIFPLGEELEKAGIDTLLVVTGDTIKSDLRPVYPITAIDLIKKIRHELPHIKIYAAIDPYRQSFQEEYRYAMQKLEAGATGFFTQPFFDIRLLEVYANMMPDVDIYWGASAVVTKRSQEYWETVNRVVFPKDFDFSMECNRAFAREALDFVRSREQNIYYMPIKVDLIEWLGGIL